MSFLSFLPKPVRCTLKYWAGKMIPVSNLESILGSGWHRDEAAGEAKWVWSRREAQLHLPPRARRIRLVFQSEYQRLTGRPQMVRFVFDGAMHHEMVAQPNNDIVLPCTNKKDLIIRVDTARPCDHGGEDTRQLGICLCQVFHDGYDLDHLSRPDEPEPTEIIPNVYPDTIQVELTTACNMSCRMCGRVLNDRGQGPHISEAVWQQILREAPRIANINFLGNGEPFMHPRLLDYMRQLDELGVAMQLTTNGVLITADKARELAKLRHLQRITVSIDSPDPALYRAVRGQELARALAGLDHLIATLPEPGRVRICAVVMRSNLESFLGFPDFLQEHHVRQLALRGVVDMKGLGDDVPAYNAHDRAILRQVCSVCEAADIEVNLLPPMPIEEIVIHSGDLGDEGIRAPVKDLSAVETVSVASAVRPTRVCCDPWEYAIITHEGLVYPCEVYNDMTPMGSLAEENFSQIWAGKRFRELRRRLLAGRSNVCRNCPRRHWGSHPFVRFAAELKLECSILSGAGTRRRLVVRNLGREPWTAATQLRIGTCRHKDRSGSVFYHSSWITPNRVASFSEPCVAPGEQATFDFEIAPTAAPEQAEWFQLLIEGQRWLPNTEFAVRTE